MIPNERSPKSLQILKQRTIQLLGQISMTRNKAPASSTMGHSVCSTRVASQTAQQDRVPTEMYAKLLWNHEYQQSHVFEVLRFQNRQKEPKPEEKLRTKVTAVSKATELH
eukprot:1912435-Amphidinium_carterae.1